MTDSDPSDYGKIQAVWCDEFEMWYLPMEGCKEHGQIYATNLVPIEALQELIKEWRERATNHEPTDPHTDYSKDHLRECADELQAVIDEYE